MAPGDDENDNAPYQTKNALHEDDDDPNQPTQIMIPCASHLTFSTLVNHPYQRMAHLLNQCPQGTSTDALLAADELTAIALGAEPAFMVVSSAETYLGKITAEAINSNSPQPSGSTLKWTRDATGWMMTGVNPLEEVNGSHLLVGHTTVLAVRQAACFRHGMRVSVSISQMNS